MTRGGNDTRGQGHGCMAGVGPKCVSNSRANADSDCLRPAMSASVRGINPESAGIFRECGASHGRSAGCGGRLKRGIFFQSRLEEFSYDGCAAASGFSVQRSGTRGCGQVISTSEAARSATRVASPCSSGFLFGASGGRPWNATSIQIAKIKSAM